MKALLLFLLFSLCLQAQEATQLIESGDVFDQKYQTEEALKFYLPAEKLLPGNADLLIKITRQYLYRMPSLAGTEEKLASARTALTYAERAVKADPKNSDAHLAVALSLGRIAQLSGNREKVAASRRIKECAEKASRLNPANDYAWHILGRWHQGIAGANSLLLGLARLIYGEIPAASNDEAVSCFKKAIALRPERLIHHMELGRTYAQMGRTEEARALLEKALAMTNREKDDPETKERGRKTLNAL